MFIHTILNSKTMLKNLLPFILLISTVSLSQTEIHRNFTKGYVVLTNGDTLRGNLAQVSESESCDTVFFKKNITDTVTGFNAGQLRMYKRDNVFYSSRIIATKKGAFVNVMELGKVNLYRYTYVFNKVSLKGIVQGTRNPLDYKEAISGIFAFDG